MTATTSRSVRQHVAVCIFGLLPQIRKRTNLELGVANVSIASPTAELLLRDYCYPTFVEHVLRANPHSQVDVFVQNNEASREQLVRELYRPRAAAFGEDGLPANISLPGQNGWRQQPQQQPQQQPLARIGTGEGRS